MTDKREGVEVGNWLDGICVIELKGGIGDVLPL